jgi:hypothetical protein
MNAGEAHPGGGAMLRGDKVLDAAGEPGQGGMHRSQVIDESIRPQPFRTERGAKAKLGMQDLPGDGLVGPFQTVWEKRSTRDWGVTAIAILAGTKVSPPQRYRNGGRTAMSAGHGTRGTPIARRQVRQRVRKARSCAKPIVPLARAVIPRPQQ